MTGDVLASVEQACAQLASQRLPVTFTEVAARSQTSKATLYRRPELRSIIEEHRAHAREARTLSGLAADIDLLRQGLEALAARVRHHEELLRDLQRQPRQGQITGPARNGLTPASIGRITMAAAV